MSTVLFPYRKSGKCALCGGQYERWGNNPQPVLPKFEQRVCHGCNESKVIPARIVNIRAGRPAY